MDMDATRTRFRRTFAYQADPHDESSSSALDETEQEDVIHSLSTQNHQTNSQFRLFLLCLPVLSSIPYLLAVAHPASQGISRTVAVLGLTSLAVTTWLLWSQVPGVTGIAFLDRLAASTGAEDTIHGDHGHHISTRRRSRRESFSIPTAVSVAKTKSPLEVWLPYLNLGLCGTLVLAGLFAPSARRGGSWGHVGLANLPGVVYVVVLAAKMLMGGVDPEKELSGLKYDFKGA
ncbi:hypothetical protein BKA67DRAFT_663674 [Truncatella angustata]|uniref:Uncharacterized protein n=1 Tax=Truncatella angustata TaxID=152316 RepID=A0A9P8RGV3_9PEZI|nr:uncharacterized protein BKA67DRAFT_663674 [Truncatella angustata]KAH6645788.1 hypothetical protein BKA67DRAFT_663674 [Truncatella angustata]KAH8197634.1 hypothetical protein TruAng_008218 [Truncatella angustata]